MKESEQTRSDSRFYFLAGLLVMNLASTVGRGSIGGLFLANPLRAIAGVSFLRSAIQAGRARKQRKQEQKESQ